MSRCTQRHPAHDPDRLPGCRNGCQQLRHRHPPAGGCSTSSTRTADGRMSSSTLPGGLACAALGYFVRVSPRRPDLPVSRPARHSESRSPAAHEWLPEEARPASRPGCHHHQVAFNEAILAALKETNRQSRATGGTDTTRGRELELGLRQAYASTATKAWRRSARPGGGATTAGVTATGHGPVHCTAGHRRRDPDPCSSADPRTSRRAPSDPLSGPGAPALQRLGRLGHHHRPGPSSPATHRGLADAGHLGC